MKSGLIFILCLSSVIAFAGDEEIYKQASIFGHTLVFEAETKRQLKCNYFYHQNRNPRDNGDSIFVQEALTQPSTSRRSLNQQHSAVLALSRHGFSLITADRPGIVFGGDLVSSIDASTYDQHLQSDAVDCGIAALEWSLKHRKGKIHFLGFGDGATIIALILKQLKIPEDRLGLVLLQGMPLGSGLAQISAREKNEPDLEFFSKWINGRDHEGDLRKSSGAGSAYWIDLMKQPSGEVVLTDLIDSRKIKSLVLVQGIWDDSSKVLACRAFEKNLRRKRANDFVEFIYFNGGHATNSTADLEIEKRFLDFDAGR
jgi:hypothetical protein